MPNTPHVVATFEVFDDAGFTMPSSVHGDGIDIFELDQDVLTPVTSGAAVIGEVLTNEVESSALSSILLGEVDVAETDGLANDSGTIGGEVSDPDIDGNANC
jgi:hypothetical protein